MTDVITCTKCATRNRVPVAASGTPRCGRCQADLPWLANVNAGEFDQVVASSALPVLVDLWAPWCGPCRALAPVLEELSRSRAGTLRIVKVNVDDEPLVSSRLGVQGIPLMLLYVNGREIDRQVGAMPGAGIARWIDASLAAATSAGHLKPEA